MFVSVNIVARKHLRNPLSRKRSENKRKILKIEYASNASSKQIANAMQSDKTMQNGTKSFVVFFTLM